MTSYANNDGIGTVENEVQYTYNTAHGKLSRIYQSHQGAVNTMSTPNTWLGYDAAVDGNDVYTHAIRVQNEVYPVLTNTVLQRYYNTDSSIDGRLHRIRYIKLFDGNFLTGDVNQTNRYEYNGTSRVVRVESYASQIDVERTMATSTGVYGAWDRFGRTLQQKWFRSTTSHVDVKHGYDYAGNRLWREDVVADANSQDHDEFYTYDGLHRLTDAQRGNLTGTYPDYTGVTSKNFEQEFTLDQLGNWPTFKHDSDGNGFDFTQTRTQNAVNELTEFTSTSWVDPVHDAAGNMTTMPQPLDPTDDFTAVYDAWNRMVEVKDGGATVLTNEYDGLNQRIVKDVTGGDTFEYYYNDRWQVNVETVEGAVEAIYAWHPYYIDALAVRYYDENTDNSGIVRHWYLQDANFNVTAVVNDSATVLERYHYTPYGEVTFLEPDFDPIVGNASAIGNNVLYTGRERDPETGLQLNRHRWYHAGLGRWLTRDPIGYRGGMNLYGYVDGRPTTRIDPSGLKPPGKGWTKACCNGKIFNANTHCCEDGRVVAKVPIWICKRPLDMKPWQVGVVDFCQLDWILPRELDVAHSYVCCDGPNMNCFGKQHFCKAGDDIPREMLATGDCDKHMVCPKKKAEKCGNPKSDTDYSVIFPCEACHDWAWE